MGIRQTPERLKKKEEFIKKHKITGKGKIPKSVIALARTEIGYSDKTVSMDIECSLSSFAEKRS